MFAGLSKGRFVVAAIALLFTVWYCLYVPILKSNGNLYVADWLGIPRQPGSLLPAAVDALALALAMIAFVEAIVWLFGRRPAWSDLKVSLFGYGLWIAGMAILIAINRTSRCIRGDMPPWLQIGDPEFRALSCVLSDVVFLAGVAAFVTLPLWFVRRRK